MVKKHTVKWTQTARDDLKSIFDYIRKRADRKQAQYVVSEIRQQALKVSIFPEMHAKEPYSEKENVRFTVKWRYKIIYEIEKDTVYVVRIFHTSQSPDNLTLNV